MKILYFDCFSGISGDMITGSLLDLGLDFNFLKKELGKLKLKGFRIGAKKIARQGISSTKFVVVPEEQHKERNLSEINNIIGKSDLDEEIKNKSKEIFLKIAHAESKIHNKPIEKIHFHEIGAIDTIIDVASAAIGIRKLGIEKVYCSKLNVGTGFVGFSHGKWPVPAPATIEILKNVPVYHNNIEAELVTPTGAAIITSFCNDFGEMPLMKVEKIGYGAGSKELQIPNVLRAYIGETEKNIEEIVEMIETNIDNMNSEIYPYLIEKLLENGAMDAYLTPIIMKKGRPAVKLNALCSPKNTEKLCKIIFEETTTLGIRIYEVRKKKLEREIKEIKTKYGKIKVKVSKLDGIIQNMMPEFEDCARIAKEKKVSLKNVYEEVKKITGK